MEFLKIAFKVIFYVINSILILYSLFYIITGIFAFFNKEKKVKKDIKHKFAVLIPARNEERVIKHLIDSLKNQNYDKDLYDIYVIPNNCKDKTKEVSIKAGSKIIECKEIIKSKGEVLNYAFDYLKDLGYDAYCIFDADNIVHKDFLKYINESINEGYLVGQGYRDTKNINDSWISSCYALFYYTQNLFFNKSRVNMNMSASINGTGFYICKKVIDKYGFNTITMTEDIEFSAKCALNNVKINFVEKAITYDEQPVTFISSCKQRLRWSVGTMQCFFAYFKKLLKKGINNKIPQSIDMAIYFSAPFIQLLSVISIIMFIILNVSDFNFNSFNKFFSHNLIFLGISYIIGVLFSLFVVIFQKKKVAKCIKGILSLIVFMISWIPINVLALFKKNNFVWEEIKHERNISIDEIE